MAYVNGLFDVGVVAEVAVFHDHHSYFTVINFRWPALKRYDLSSDVVRGGGGGAGTVPLSITTHIENDDAFTGSLETVP